MINKIKIIYGGSNLIEGFNYEINGKIGRYQGEFENSIPNGNGTWNSYDSDDYLNGDWNDGNFTNGEGKLTFPNGEIYEGEWKKKKKNGQGTLTWSTGDIYVGEFKNDIPNGKGTFTKPNGDYKIGQFKKKFLSGKVKITLVNGIYEGEWENNFPNGQGKYTMKNGDYEEGIFKDDEFEYGKVKKTFDDGEIYEGEWENDSPNGEGKIIKKNIYILDGKWNDDQVVYGIVVFDNLPLKIELINSDKEEKSVIININNNKFTLKLNENDEVDEIINKNDKEEKNVKLKENFDILYDNDDYSSIKYVNAMNNILEDYGKSKIPNIYKFYGLPISFESKINLLLSKDFNLYITNLLNA